MKKQLRISALILIAALLAALLAGCSDTKAYRLVGAWKAEVDRKQPETETPEYESTTADSSVRFYFKSNGRCEVASGYDYKNYDGDNYHVAEAMYFLWKLDGDKLVLTMADEDWNALDQDDSETAFDIAFKGDNITLTMNNDDGSTLSFILTRKD